PPAQPCALHLPAAPADQHLVAASQHASTQLAVQPGGPTRCQHSLLLEVPRCRLVPIQSLTVAATASRRTSSTARATVGHEQAALAQLVAAMFNSALEALLRHDSVRASNGESMQNAALREHNDAEALRGASWNPTKQRWRAQIYYPGRLLHLGYFQHVEHAAKAYDLMAIKLRGMHTPLNFVPETYSDMCELLAQVDQVAGWWVMSARQQQRMDWEAALEASDPTMGIDWEDAAPTATTHPCQPSPPLAPHSAAGCGMAMGDDVATRFDAALDAVLRHTSVRVPSNLNRLLLGRQHNGAGGLCGATYDKNKQCWQAKIKHCSRTYHLGSFQCGEHAAKAHDLMAIKCRGMHTPLNFVSKTYNDMYELLAQMEQQGLTQLHPCLQANAPDALPWP
ncbi:AP2/ERF domain-containing protein, partial [Haematococcus lacustris]